MIPFTVDIFLVPRIWSNYYESHLPSIAEDVLKENNKAKLAKGKVVEWIKVSTGEKQAILSNILDLYDNDNTSLPILFNDSLNKELEKLAQLLMFSIIFANKSVESHVKEVFEIFDSF